jgi:hypothetical protein
VKFAWAGAWLVATYKGFAEYDLYQPVFDEYEATILSARAGQLLSSIRRLGQIDAKELEIRRKLARLKPSETLPLVKKLASLNIIDLEWQSPEQQHVAHLQTLGESAQWVFQAAGELFYASDPTEQEQASLLALDLTAIAPLKASTLYDRLQKAGFSDLSARGAVDHLSEVRLLNQTRETERGEPIISNPYAFRSLGPDSGSILSKLNEIDAEKAITLLEQIKNSPGVPLPADTDQNVLQVLIEVGLVDYSGIRVRGSSKIREFPTIPHLWGVFDTVLGNAGLDDDLIDDAKLFLNSIRYGEFYATRSYGRIFDPAVLVDRLVRRGEVGPATNIGSDYPLPLSRGIVSIVESRIRPGRFHMQLRKEDVGKSVLNILQQGTILESSGDVPEGLIGPTGQYQSPETVRVSRKLPSKLQRATDELAFELRSYRKRQ